LTSFSPTTALVNTFLDWAVSREKSQNHPELSAGIQKSTNRHTFEFVVGRQVVMTTAQYAYQGTRVFGWGSIFSEGFARPAGFHKDWEVTLMGR